jgi:hypothetical protein
MGEPAKDWSAFVYPEELDSGGSDQELGLDTLFSALQRFGNPSVANVIAQGKLWALAAAEALDFCFTATKVPCPLIYVPTAERLQIA